MPDDQNEFADYLRNNLTAESAQEKGTAIPADSLAQIIQEIIKLEPELKNFVGNEIRTGYMSAENYMVYCHLVWSAYHLLLRGKMFSIPMKHTPKDILFIAKIRASASTSIDAKLIETLVESRRKVTVDMPLQKKGFLRR